LFASGTAPPACIGDCGADGAVTIDDLITGVNIALEGSPVAACPAFECSPECHPGPAVFPGVTVDCIIRGVNNALSGCPLNVCFSDADCDDGNACSDDRCTERGCTHACICV
jgi:hypothetical protein